MIDRNVETKMVKDALAAAGIKAKVRHGTGTACGWLHIEIPRQNSRLETVVLGEKAVRIAEGIRGGQGIYDGRIGWNDYVEAEYRGADYTDQVSRWERS